MKKKRKIHVKTRTSKRRNSKRKKITRGVKRNRRTIRKKSVRKHVVEKKRTSKRRNAKSKKKTRGVKRNRRTIRKKTVRKHVAEKKDKRIPKTKKRIPAVKKRNTLKANPVQLVPLRFTMRNPNLHSKLIEPEPAKDTGLDTVGIGPVLHLPTNPAGQMSIQANTLQRLGVPASFCSYVISTYKYPNGLPSPISKLPVPNQGYAMMNFAAESAKKYNIFHFHAGETCTKYNYTDLPYLSLLNKKLVMTYWGSELRRQSIAERNNIFARVKPGKLTTETEILNRLNVISRYVDAVIVSDYELFEHLKGFFKKVYLVRIAVDYSRFSPHYPSLTEKKPLIVHAPSSRYIKGTDNVVKAVQRLKAYADFEYIQVENTSNAETIEHLKKADIVIDQLQLGIYATLAIEGMLLGKPVVTYIRDDLWKKYPKGLPIVSANPNTIEKVLYKLISDPELRYELGVKGRQYAIKHHSPEKIARQLITIYKELYAY